MAEMGPVKVKLVVELDTRPLIDQLRELAKRVEDAEKEWKK